MSEKIKKPLIPMETQDSIWGAVFISPWLIGFFVFVAFPILFSLVISFCKWKVGESPEFIGLANYAAIFDKSQGLDDFTYSHDWQCRGFPVSKKKRCAVSLF